MPDEIVSPKRRIYPWWVAPLITTLVTFISVPVIFGVAFLYLKYWHPAFLNYLNNSFNIFNAEQLINYTNFTFDKLIDLWITWLCTILYNISALIISAVIGIRRKKAYTDFMLPTLQEQILEKSGELGKEYKRISESKVKIKALMDLLKLTPDEAVDLMDLRTTTELASLKNIYVMSEDFIAFNCCKEQIFNSAVKKSCKFMKIHGIAQFEFIGRFSPNFNTGDGSIDRYGLEQSVFLHLLEVKNEIEFQILLMDPNGPDANKYIRNRINSLKNLGQRITIDSYKREIEDTIRFTDYLKNNLNEYDRFKNKKIKIDYRLFTDEPVFRYYITRDTLFLSQYVEGDHGHTAMVYEIGRSNKSFHYSFLRHFDARWERFK